MSAKVKLISFISAFVLVLGIMIIGVLSAEQVQVNIGGSVSFNATNVYAKVSGDISGAETGNKTFSTLTYSASETTGDESDWTNLALEFTETPDPIIITVTVENLSTQRTLTVNLENTLQGDGLDIAVTRDTASYTSATDVELGTAGSDTASTTFTLSLTVADPNEDLTDANFGYILNMFDESYVPPPALQVTSVSSSGATEDTYTDLAGGVAIDGSIDLSGIEFATGETTLTISMTSLNANYIKNIVSYDSGTVSYNTTGTSGTLFVHSTSLYLPQNSSGELTSGESKDLTIYVNNNTGSPTTISGLQVSFEEKESLLQADTENEYWYVEMGTVMGQTQSEYIRWKYIASVDDSTGSDVATKYATFDANTAPTGEGYFYLETNVLSAIGRDGTNNMIEVSFNNEYIYNSSHSPTYYHQQHGWTNVQANDYATSNVRQYINGQDSYDFYPIGSSSSTGYTPSGRLSNMYDDLNIDTANDIIYNKIITRSLGELYQDNSGGSSSATSPTDVTFPDLSGADAGYRYQSTDEDAFWLLSYYEVYQLTGNSTTASSDSGRVWPSDSANYYWLRSPYSSLSSNAYNVYTSGNLIITNVNYTDYAARAAFKFSI